MCRSTRSGLADRVAGTGRERSPLPVGIAVSAALTSAIIALALVNDNSPFPDWLTVMLLVTSLLTVAWVFLERLRA